jgi:hypothetical protein
MPKDFERCVKKGGRVRTVKPKRSKFLRICFDEEGSHAGEVKTTKKHKSKG